MRIAPPIKDAKEDAKMYGMFLKHSGVLKNYAEESKPCKVVVQRPLGTACFNTWYSNQKLQCERGTVIIIECCFVKKVMLSSIFLKIRYFI